MGGEKRRDRGGGHPFDGGDINDDPSRTSEDKIVQLPAQVRHALGEEIIGEIDDYLVVQQSSSGHGSIGAPRGWA